VGAAGIGTGATFAMASVGHGMKACPCPSDYVPAPYALWPRSEDLPLVSERARQHERRVDPSHRSALNNKGLEVQVMVQPV
jgi:hypothetical protein